MAKECYIDYCHALSFDGDVMVRPLARYPIGRFEETEIDFFKSETFVDRIPPHGIIMDSETGMRGCVVYVFRTEDDIKSDTMREKYNHVELLEAAKKADIDEYLSHIKRVAHQILVARSLGETIGTHTDITGGSLENVHDENVLKALENNTAVLKEIKEKIPTEQTIFDANHRANARSEKQIDETEIEKVHRLLKDWKWKDVAKQVYFDSNGGVDIPEAELDREVKRLQKAHRRAYPEHYKKAK